MLHEPTPSTPTLAPPAAAPEPRIVTTDALAPHADLPTDLRPLARRARRDIDAARELAEALLGRHWDAPLVALATGMAPETVTSLAGVRRPGTAAAFVADDVAERARLRSVPVPRVS